MQEPRQMERHCHTPRLEGMRGKRLPEGNQTSPPHLLPNLPTNQRAESPTQPTRLQGARVKTPATLRAWRLACTAPHSTGNPVRRAVSCHFIARETD